MLLTILGFIPTGDGNVPFSVSTTIPTGSSETTKSTPKTNEKRHTRMEAHVDAYDPKVGTKKASSTPKKVTVTTSDEDDVEKPKEKVKEKTKEKPSEKSKGKEAPKPKATESPKPKTSPKSGSSTPLKSALKKSPVEKRPASEISKSDSEDDTTPKKPESRPEKKRKTSKGPVPVSKNVRIATEHDERVYSTSKKNTPQDSGAEGDDEDDNEEDDKSTKKKEKKSKKSSLPLKKEKEIIQTMLSISDVDTGHVRNVPTDLPLFSCLSVAKKNPEIAKMMISRGASIEKFGPIKFCGSRILDESNGRKHTTNCFGCKDLLLHLSNVIRGNSLPTYDVDEDGNSEEIPPLIAIYEHVAIGGSDDEAVESICPFCLKAYDDEVHKGNSKSRKLANKKDNFVICKEASDMWHQMAALKSRSALHDFSRMSIYEVLRSRGLNNTSILTNILGRRATEIICNKGPDGKYYSVYAQTAYNASKKTLYQQFVTPKNAHGHRADLHSIDPEDDDREDICMAEFMVLVALVSTYDLGARLNVKMVPSLITSVKSGLWKPYDKLTTRKKPDHPSDKVLRVCSERFRETIIQTKQAYAQITDKKEKKDCAFMDYGTNINSPAYGFLSYFFACSEEPVENDEETESSNEEEETQERSVKYAFKITNLDPDFKKILRKLYKTALDTNKRDVEQYFTDNEDTEEIKSAQENDADITYVIGTPSNNKKPVKTPKKKGSMVVFSDSEGNTSGESDVEKTKKTKSTQKASSEPEKKSPSNKATSKSTTTASSSKTSTTTTTTATPTKSSTKAPKESTEDMSGVKRPRTSSTGAVDEQPKKKQKTDKASESVPKPTNYFEKNKEAPATTPKEGTDGVQKRSLILGGKKPLPSSSSSSSSSSSTTITTPTKPQAAQPQPQPQPSSELASVVTIPSPPISPKPVAGKKPMSPPPVKKVLSFTFDTKTDFNWNMLLAKVLTIPDMDDAEFESYKEDPVVIEIEEMLPGVFIASSEIVRHYNKIHNGQECELQLKMENANPDDILLPEYQFADNLGWFVKYMLMYADIQETGLFGRVDPVTNTPIPFTEWMINFIDTHTEFESLLTLIDDQISKNTKEGNVTSLIDILDFYHFGVREFTKAPTDDNPNGVIYLKEEYVDYVKTHREPEADVNKHLFNIYNGKIKAPEKDKLPIWSLHHRVIAALFIRGFIVVENFSYDMFQRFEKKSVNPETAEVKSKNSFDPSRLRTFHFGKALKHMARFFGEPHNPTMLNSKNPLEPDFEFSPELYFKEAYKYVRESFAADAKHNILVKISNEFNLSKKMQSKLPKGLKIKRNELESLIEPIMTFKSPVDHGDSVISKSFRLFNHLVYEMVATTRTTQEFHYYPDISAKTKTEDLQHEENLDILEADEIDRKQTTFDLKKNKFGYSHFNEAFFMPPASYSDNFYFYKYQKAFIDKISGKSANSSNTFAEYIKEANQYMVDEAKNNFGLIPDTSYDDELLTNLLSGILRCDAENAELEENVETFRKIASPVLLYAFNILEDLSIVTVDPSTKRLHFGHVAVDVIDDLDDDSIGSLAFAPSYSTDIRNLNQSDSPIMKATDFLGHFIFGDLWNYLARDDTSYLLRPFPAKYLKKTMGFCPPSPSWLFFPSVEYYMDNYFDAHLTTIPSVVMGKKTRLNTNPQFAEFIIGEVPVFSEELPLIQFERLNPEYYFKRADLMDALKKEPDMLTAGWFGDVRGIDERFQTMVQVYYIDGEAEEVGPLETLVVKLKNAKLVKNVDTSNSKNPTQSASEELAKLKQTHNQAMVEKDDYPEPPRTPQIVEPETSGKNSSVSTEIQQSPNVEYPDEITDPLVFDDRMEKISEEIPIDDMLTETPMGLILPSFSSSSSSSSSGSSSKIHSRENTPREDKTVSDLMAKLSAINTPKPPVTFADDSVM